MFDVSYWDPAIKLIIHFVPWVVGFLCIATLSMIIFDAINEKPRRNRK